MLDLAAAFRHHTHRVESGLGFKVFAAQPPHHSEFGFVDRWSIVPVVVLPRLSRDEFTINGELNS